VETTGVGFSECAVLRSLEGFEPQPGDRVREARAEERTIPMVAERKSEWFKLILRREWASVVVPGSGQIWTNRKRERGIAYAAAFVTAAYMTWHYHRKLNDAYDDCVDARNKYQGALSPSALADYYRKQQSAYSDVEDFKRDRDILTGVMVGIWAVNLVDTFFGEDIERWLFSDAGAPAVRMTAMPGGAGVGITFNLGDGR